MQLVHDTSTSGDELSFIMACDSSSASNIFTQKQIHHILKQSLGEQSWQVIGCDERPATTGLAGFLGDHFRVTIHAKVNGSVKKIRLFVKSMPARNPPKADFINRNCYFKREVVALRLAEELRAADGANPWCARAYLCNDNIVVMPDLAAEGYRTLRNYETLDLGHSLLAAASLARFHASFTNYVTERTLSHTIPYHFLEEHGDVMTEPTFCDSPWLKAATKLSFNFLRAFSDKFEQYPNNLEHLLAQRYLDACASLTEHEGTLNVMLHKDLWINNIMFKYNGEVPVSALLIDFQCLRYGPPAFDLMIFLYLTTSRKFRERYEGEIFRHYFEVFWEVLDGTTKSRMKHLNYDYETFVGWCERSRMFGLFEALGIFPYVLMEPKVAEKTFDDPDTFTKYCDEDRTEPVLAYARLSQVYLQRQLEVNEEFVERYILKQA